jgi:multidrug transporter EmrE-like cation transporter
MPHSPARYRRLLKWMVLASLIAMGLALLYLKAMLGAVPLGMAIWTGLGVFVSVLLAAALMGLVFLSSGSGHDEAIVDPLEEGE